MAQSKDRGRLNGQEKKTLTRAVHETHFRSKDTQTLKVKGWKRCFKKMEINKQKAGVAKL